MASIAAGCPTNLWDRATAMSSTKPFERSLLRDERGLFVEVSFTSPL